MTKEQCAAMVASRTPRRLPDGLWGIASVLVDDLVVPPGSSIGVIDGPTRAAVLCLWTDASGRQWIWGPPDPDDWARAELSDMPLDDIPPEGFA